MEPRDVIREAADIMELAYLELQRVLVDNAVRLTPASIERVRDALSKCSTASLDLGTRAARAKIPYRPQPAELEDDLATRDTRPTWRRKPPR